MTLAGPFTIVDNQQGTFACGSGPLAPGASTQCTVTRSISQADLDAGFVANTASASASYNGQPVGSNLALETVTATQTKALALTKAANPTTYTTLGQTIVYSYVITNTGNVTIAAPLAVTDDKATVTVVQQADGKLSPLETTTGSASYTITQADLDKGSVKNTTFAVWLTPRSNWRVKYRNWSALKKLKFVWTT